MITQRTKELILETARIEEVVGDYVKLKKRGVNMIGLCPFHHEKTPSFNVNPQRNIYKCFGCGKGGDSIGFIMDHEHLTFPETLRYLAAKYHIEIEEDETPEENAEAKNERESLYVVSSFAQKYFSEALINTGEGKAIGLSYFKERGFTDETIHKFQLGYSPDAWDIFTKAALSEAFQSEYLVKTGLTIQSEKEITGDPNGKTEIRFFDRFRGRVMFPIHNLSGRVIGFGGRTLKTDPKQAKYVNSPDSEIYHKSQVLYGVFFAKKEIIAKDNCYLVEGYTDVISMHQSGVENVVASSGTSLTTDQIRLISRYTKNITVLYDGDAAGIKASMRGIDMILEEGLNVRIVLFPDGDDPDSFARKSEPWELREFIAANAKDFIMFKAGLLMKEAVNNPVKKAELIRDIVESIARIQDPILRSEYIKECSVTMTISEHILIAETNKASRQVLRKSIPQDDLEELLPEVMSDDQTKEATGTEHQERDIIRLLMNYGHLEILFEEPSAPNVQITPLRISEFIIHEIETDQLKFDHEGYSVFYREYITSMALHANSDAVLKDVAEAKNAAALQNYFLNHRDEMIRSLAIDLVSSQYVLSENWKKSHHISVPHESDILRQAVLSAVYSLKLKKVRMMLDKIVAMMKEGPEESVMEELMIRKQKLDKVKSELAKMRGTVVDH